MVPRLDKCEAAMKESGVLPRSVEDFPILSEAEVDGVDEPADREEAGASEDESQQGAGVRIRSPLVRERRPESENVARENETLRREMAEMRG